MSILPELEIGLFNAWILMLFVIAYNIMPYFLSVKKLIEQENLKKIGHPDIKLTKAQKQLGLLINIFFIIPIIYSIFLPIRLNSIGIYIGLVIYFFGIIIGITAMYYFFKTPTGKLVANGIYRFSRNPIYLSIILIFAGTAIVCISWIFFLITMIFAILIHYLIIYEEKYCLEKYKNDYRRYMNQTSRWFGLKIKNRQ